MLRPLAIVLAIGAGALAPGLSSFYGAIRWILFLMLFLGVSNMPLRRFCPEWTHAKLLLAWPPIVLAGWALLSPFGREASLAGLLVAATPTATAAPVVTAMLGGDAAFVSVAFLGSNLCAAFLLPPLLHLAGSRELPSSTPIFAQTLGLVLAPLALSLLVRRIPGTSAALARARRASFPLWLCALVLAAAKTSAFLRSHPRTDQHALAAIAAGSALLCAMHFTIGRVLGGKDRPLEASQSLGQKNTMLTLWLGLSAFGPVPALGPAFYVLWHNLWNAAQMARRERIRN